MIFLASIILLEKVKQPSEGLQLYIIDLKGYPGIGILNIQKNGVAGLQMRRIVLFDDWGALADTLTGRRGQKFRLCIR